MYKNATIYMLILDLDTLCIYQFQPFFGGEIFVYIKSCHPKTAIIHLILSNLEGCISPLLNVSDLEVWCDFEEECEK